MRRKRLARLLRTLRAMRRGPPSRDQLLLRIGAAKKAAGRAGSAGAGDGGPKTVYDRRVDDRDSTPDKAVREAAPVRRRLLSIKSRRKGWPGRPERLWQDHAFPHHRRGRDPRRRRRLGPPPHDDRLLPPGRGGDVGSKRA